MTDVLDIPARAWQCYDAGVLALQGGRPDQAVRHFAEAARLVPGRADYHNALGEAHRLGGSPAAADCYRAALRLDPDFAAAHHALGVLHQDRREWAAAAEYFRAALAARPDYARAQLNLGRVLQTQGDLPAAADCYRAALRLQPDYALAHNNLGVVFQAQSRLTEAAACFRQALQYQPDYPEAHFNLGFTLQLLLDPVAATDCYREAVRLRSDYARAQLQLGLALEQQRREAEAIPCYEAAARLAPDDPAPYRHLAGALQLLGRWAEAGQALEQAHRIRPDDPHTFALLVFHRQHVCDWRDYEAGHERLWHDAEKSIAAGETTPVIPFQSLTVPWPADRLLAVARSHCDAAVRHLAEVGPGEPVGHAQSRTGRLRVGYLSGDFHDHPISHLAAGMFARHDRGEFEVFAYSFGPNDGSDYRRRVVAGCEHFRDVSALSVPELARRIAADGIHVLVDLMGHTGVSRLAALALRPAPVQVNYLGQLGTMGADFFDYVLGDPVATPPALAPHFTERIVTLPHTYMVTDGDQPVPPPPAPRGDYGLPETGFVFCCFNNTYKIDPAVFAAWMRILRQVPGAVLWLNSTSPVFEGNVRREAAARGVAPDRLRFASFCPRDEHARRQQAADLFLDTPVYNAAATAASALWAGLPVLTCPGETFAGRVGASLLTAAGLPELIAADLADYEHKAVELARRPDALRALREGLMAGRTTMPLFDTSRFVRNLERAYRAMWATYTAGGPPQPLAVSESG